MKSFEVERIATLKEFPGFEIIKKSDSGFMKLLDFLLKLITAWQMKTFMVDFTTTIGEKVYIPSRWDSWSEASRTIILRHERVHMEQKRKYKLLYVFMYLLLPFPVGIAYFRRKFEQEAYEESLRGYAEAYGVDVLDRDSLKDGMVAHFTTAEYFWMWPFRKSIESWYDDAVQRTKDEAE